MRRSREVSPCHDVKRAERIPDVHEWKILGKGTHGEIFASPDVDEVAVKRFCTRTASRYSICHLAIRCEAFDRNLGYESS